MTIRTTLYALFAGVSIGNFQDNTNICLEDNEFYIKRAGVDMEWLYEIIRILEGDNSILKELIQRMKNKNPNVPEEKIKSFINQLLENEVLLTELRPSLSTFNSLDNVISIVEKV